MPENSRNFSVVEVSIILTMRSSVNSLHTMLEILLVEKWDEFPENVFRFAAESI